MTWTGKMGIVLWTAGLLLGAEMGSLFQTEPWRMVGILLCIWAIISTYIYAFDKTEHLRRKEREEQAKDEPLT